MFKTVSVFAWDLQILGSKIYSENVLKEQLDLPDEINSLPVERRDFIIKLSKTNLDDFYQSNGYFSANITYSKKEEIIDSTVSETYIFTVSEGDRYMFGEAKIEIIGNAKSLVEIDELNVPKGKYYNPENINDDQKIIRDTYQKNGYLHMTLDHLEYIDTLAKKVHVIYSIEHKEQVRMGNFRSILYRSSFLPGQNKAEIGLSDTAWVNTLWEIPQDSIIDGNYFFAFRAKLFSTQLFSQVNLEDTLQENGLSDITLTAYERIPGEANYGFFYEQLYGFGISFSSLHRNLFGSFHEGGVGAILAENKQELSFNYAHPLLFGTRVSWIPTAIRLDEKIIFNHEILPEPANPDNLEERTEIANRTSVSFGLSSHLRTRNTFDFKFLRLNSDNDLKPDNSFKIKGEISFIYDRTDNSYDPIIGYKIIPSFGAGGNLENESLDKFKETKSLSDLLDIGLTHGYTYINASAYVYYPLHRRLLSALAFSFGNIFNNAALDDAETFFQGGGRTLRGYRFRSVFPSRDSISYNSDGKPKTHLIPGLSPTYYRINEELRFNLPVQALRNFQVVQFTDFVRISDSDDSFKPAQEMSVGLGVRYKWQFLIFRLDYALKTQFKDFKPDKFSFSHIVFDLSQAI